MFRIPTRNDSPGMPVGSGRPGTYEETLRLRHTGGAHHAGAGVALHALPDQQRRSRGLREVRPVWALDVGDGVAGLREGGTERAASLGRDEPASLRADCGRARLQLGLLRGAGVPARMETGRLPAQLLEARLRAVLTYISRTLPADRRC